MPSPSAFDPWLASRRFGIVIDAGSSGSRLQIYSWKDATAVRYAEGQKVFNSLPKVEKGAKDGEDWVSKVEPGISTFGDNPENIASYLTPLLAHAQKHIPPSLQPETPLFLLATAGMRLLSPDKQSAILTATCDFFRFHSHFKLDGPSSKGACGSSVRTISGEDEGLFGWIAVNYLMDGFGRAKDVIRDQATYGFLDMGGASTQIAFEPGIAEREHHADKLVKVKLRLMGGDEIHHQVFVTTWLGYGTNQARERYVGKAISDFETFRVSHSEEEELVPDPCLPVGLRLTETPVHTGPSTAHTRKAHTLLGTGSFEQCLKHTASLLNKSAPCPDTPCLFNGVHVPPIDFSLSHFIGVSEYWYSSEHVFGLGGAYDVVQYERAASEFCSRSWDELVREHDTSRAAGHIGGDGEVENGGRVVGTGKWGREIELSRLEMQCFKAAWIVNVLHEGIGLPRIVDPGGNRTTKAGGDEADERAEQKGLGKPTFQSLDTVGDTAISWTLGKMVLEASKEVPPASAATPPLLDPLDPSASEDDKFDTLEPTRPPFIDFDKFEDHISHRLPSSLTRQSLGISPLALLFYFTIITVILCLTYRLRHRVRTTIRRMSRGSFKREKPELIFDAYGVEEGKGVLSSVSFSLRRLLTSIRSQGRPSGLSIPKLSSFRHIHSSSGRISPRATPPMFPAFPPNGNASFYQAPSSRSGSSTPTGTFDDAYPPNPNGLSSGLAAGAGVNAGHPLSAFAQSCSRNSSQMNLTTLVPRTISYSRSAGT
ncbi:nucleoside phosphatase family-domain-containing protein [Gautieria morchelliformis]|nr:nucleoside phosphatase family-domain-containing protein [Gautieria morchelliformis]